jgi:peptide deformylase
MPKTLPATRFGNPILRSVAQKLAPNEIVSDEIQNLIDDIRHTIREKSYGVGLAAPQVGASIALSVIGIKPTPNRPNLTPFETVIINPEIIETYGKPQLMWEGCISCGTDDDILFGQLPRYESIKLRWLDENAKQREEKLDGFVAQVAQHETDHLNGILFVDHVTDSKTLMMADEYRKRILDR